MNTQPRFTFPKLSTPVKILLSAAVIVVIVAAYFAIQSVAGTQSRRMVKLVSWLRNPEAHADWVLEANTRCEEAPFQMPTRGYIGFVWGDSFQVGHRHQGLDIFGGTEVNESPVYAAYPGYLTRLDVWKSSLIIRIPEDPLKPSRQIWTYYTHLADSKGNSFISSEFPPGTSEMYVEAGTLLGYQGNYSGDPVNPTGVHLHFSIVMDNGSGRWLNELEKKNTLDPSPYLGLELNSATNPDRVPVCPSGDS
jgi:murein DD-endopeptidase MepM/ murein hydrolase activator NlpD